MNLRAPFLIGEDMDFVGELKGHCSVLEVQAEDLDFSNQIDGPDFYQAIPEPLSVPLNRFWQTDSVLVHVYVLTGRNLINPGSSAVGA